jgi:sialate O-acetylesterase
MKLHKTILFLLLLFASSDFCQVKLPKLIGDGMVLQRVANVKIWGWASVGEKNYSIYRFNIPCDRK